MMNETQLSYEPSAKRAKLGDNHEELIELSLFASSFAWQQALAQQALDVMSKHVPMSFVTRVEDEVLVG